jgi:hypothetical protein
VDYDGFKFELGLVRLNWSLSNKQLLADFKVWLQQNRPLKITCCETRGAVSLTEKLKYLSALRLLLAMTAAQAGDHTAAFLGSPLYWSDDNWYDARKKAESVTQDISSPFFDWA